MADEAEDGPRAGDFTWGTRADTAFPWPTWGTAKRTWKDEDGEWYAELED